MAEKIRANQRQSALAGGRDPFLSIDYKSSEQSIASPAAMCYAADCGTADLATFDIYEWETRVKAVLPGGRVKICRDGNPWDSAAGEFSWACTANPGSTGAPLVIKIGWYGKGIKPDGRADRALTPPSAFPPGIALAVES
jgi:type IV pilus assembly protein PilV